MSKKKRLRNLTAMLATVLTLSLATPALANGELSNGESKFESGWTHSANLEEIVYDGKTKHPRFMKGILSPVIESDKEIVQQFQTNSFLHFDPTDQQLQVVKSETDDQNKQHVLYQQLYKGTPVYGKFLQVHLNANRQIYAIMNSTAEGMDQLNLNVNPSLTGEQAVAKYKAHLEQQLGYTIETGGTFHDMAVSQPQASLRVYEKEGAYLLVYVIDFNYMKPEFGNWTGFVDASSGQVIDEFSKIERLDTSRNSTGTGDSFSGQQRPLNIFLDNPGNPSPIYVLVDNTKNMSNGGYIITYNEKTNYPVTSDSTKHFTDKHGVDAHYLTGKVYDYYKQNFNRDSLDGNGMKMVSYVHDGTNVPNAFWTMLTPTQGVMFYGDGDGVGYKCMSCEMDVVAHELTHGLTAFTADLDYVGQSGALNEAFSDIMAAVMDGNWTVGEDTGTIIRDMSNPNAKGQPQHLDQYVNTVTDYRGVHVNSGIPNHAAYLIATKLDQAGYNGKSLLGKLAYYALTKYLTHTSQFIDARNAFYTAVDDLGVSSTDITTVRNIVDQAWKEVGIPYTDSIAADAFEPNNTFALAKTITFGTKIPGTLQTDDLDFYKFTIGGNVTQNVYAYLYGYSGNMAAILFKDTNTVPVHLTNTTDPSITYSTYGASAFKQSLEPGNYYLLIDTYGESFNSKGPYSLFFTNDSSKSAITSHLAERINEAGQLLDVHTYMPADKKNALNQAVTEALSVTGSVYAAETQFNETLKLDTAIKTFSAETDKAAPSWSSGSALSASNITTSGLKLTWPLAQDALSGVTQYKIYQGSTLLGTVAASVNTYDVSTLSANTPYTFTVKAGDALGNWTTTGLSVTATTLSNSGGGGGGCCAGGGFGGGFVPSTPEKTTEGQQAVAETALKSAVDGKVTITVDQKEAVLPVNAFDLIGNNKLQLNLGTAVLSLDSSILKDLANLLGSNKGKDAKLVFKHEKLNESESQQLINKAAGANGSMKPATEIYNFELQAVDGGQSLKLGKFEKPVELTLTYKQGTNPDLLGVYYYNESTSQWEYVGGTSNKSNNTITVVLSHFSKYAVVELDKQFNDIPSDHWANKALKSLSAKHIVTGTSETMFSPEAKTTRAEFAALLVRTLGLKASKPAPFQDVDQSAWYTDAVAAAYEAGLIGGRSETKFAPLATMTREEMAAMLVRAYEFKTAKKLGQGELSLVDNSLISGWAKGQVQTAVSNGLMNGIGNSKFAPQELTNRAQSAQAIYNLLQKL
ncbi:M4 family metallopeptidase [Paenibacillus andongensis]|uniref:M4 family metallopeptidase n=1 Tax=Paenibacillus andongensis TaxID=2975482 RepID=UPI0021BAF63E|nr:M4 family metallopeptidase [Paenibacillus andongensis]